MTQPYPPIIQMTDEKPVGSGKWPIFAVAFLTVFGNTIIWTGLLFYIKEVIGASEGMVGLCTSAGMGSYAIGLLFLGKLVPHVRPKPAVLWALTCVLVCSSVISLVKSSWYVLTFQIIGGIAMTFHWSPLMGILCHGIEGRALNRAISKFNLSWSSGGILGPVFAGFLSEYNNYYPLILGPFFIAASWTVMAAAKNMEGSDDAAEQDEENSPEGKETRLRFPAWVAIFTGFITLGIIIVVFPLHSRVVLNISKKGIGIFLFQRSLVLTFTFVFMGAVSFWHYSRSSVLSSNVMFAACLLGLWHATDYIPVLLIMTVAGVATAFSYSNSLFHGVAGSENRTARAAVHETLLAFGFIIGASGGGFLYEATSLKTVIAVMLIILGISFVVQGVMMASYRNFQPQNTQNTQK